ncbi:TlpA family protein disulfide reductase [Puia dinghuensis]|uniref:Thioredoxin domain-containing protein n=1 Tax=Puia dinghuensis TaxID=1792502 RepID=A0A8J2UFP6_9BACT|nr:TlpA disulfide reductase family protein [Puia dinghuensis]GGB11598.1 hypothetical protein GCM10011511_39040 [Puia dinghuensis]
MKIVPSILMLLLFSTGFAQGRFSVSVILPREMIHHQLSVRYDNGKQEVEKRYAISGKPVNMADRYFSRYAVITIEPDTLLPGLAGHNTFFISGEPATIDLSSKDRSRQCLPRLSHAYSEDVMGAALLREYTKPVEKELADLNNEPNIKDDTLWDEKNLALRRRLLDKELEFIKANTSRYFSFWLFRKEIAPNMFAEPVETKRFYTSVFSQQQRSSEEGRVIEDILQSRVISVSENVPAPNFKTVTVDGTPIDFKGRSENYLLINFWATWCVPCVAELPAIQTIHNKYRGKVRVISVSLDADSIKFRNFIRDYPMNWDNIYHDNGLSAKFGVRSALPMLFLIDPAGMIIYNRQSGKETDFSHLSRLNQILDNRLNN